MSIVAEFVIPTEAVPGGRTLKALPRATIRLERIIPSDEAVHPIFWVTRVGSETFLDEVRHETGITDVEELVRVDDAILYRATWRPEEPVIGGIKTLGATILKAVGTADEWVFQVIAEERRRLRSFEQIFAEQGIPVELRRISSFTGEPDGDNSVTPKQREALVAAYERGYYDEPRAVTQEDIGDQFDISGRAVSKRLRGGTRNLIRSTLVEPTGRTDPEAG